MDVRRRFLGTSKITSIDDYLTIEALEDELRVKLILSDSSQLWYYCKNGDGNWRYAFSDTTTISINAGETLSFKGELNIGVNMSGVGHFEVNKNFNLRGNIMSLLFSDFGKDTYSLEGKDAAFCYLFKNCTTLKKVSPNFLPALILSTDCYYCMFYGCTSLIEPPKLPNTELESGCYSGMFYGCTSLVSAPELPATIMKLHCYSSMFLNCTNLINPPKLNSTNLADYCYYYMFAGCESLVNAPELPATTLTYSCYGHMFWKCTNLITAPELPATILTMGCYNSMFSRCSSLTTAPELPATILTSDCYNGMFDNCSSLNYIKMLATDISALRCLEFWVRNVATTGVFIKAESMTSLSKGSHGIPRGWVVQSI